MSKMQVPGWKYENLCSTDTLSKETVLDNSQILGHPDT